MSRAIGLLLFGAILVAAGCSSGSAATAQPSRQATPERSTLGSPLGSPQPSPTAERTTAVSPSVPDLNGRYALSSGKHLHLECRGSGSPTIVLEVGGEDTKGGSWIEVYEGLAQVSRTCAYDRANLGRSDPDPGPRTMQDVADSLVDLLVGADVPGPYVFVGGSLGGNIVGVLAADHPELVAGTVFVDSEPANDNPALDPLRANLAPDVYAECCDDAGNEPAYDSPENREHIDWAGGHAVELASVAAQPAVPTVVLTAGRPDCEPDWPCDAIAEDEAALQHKWIEGNSAGVQRIIDSGHVVQRDAPGEIVRAAREVVDQVRTK